MTPYNQPFAEQLEFFRAKTNLPTERWDDIRDAEHDRAFIVAGAQAADLLDDLNAAVLKAIEQGTGLEAFRKDFKALVAKHGWTGWTGEGSKQGVAWRTKVIYQTNLATSYAAGRYRQLTDPDLRAILPYWRYKHADGVLHPRPLHVAWDGLTLPPEHEFWQAHFPPNGWGCHCRVTAVAKNDYLRAVANGRGPANAPPAGATAGIDRGFAYTPGASVADELKNVADRKLEKLPAAIGARYAQATQPLTAAARQAAYRAWLTRIDTDPLAKSERPIVGAIASVDVDWLNAHTGEPPQTAEMRISSAVVNGPKAGRHEAKGDAIPRALWENLPDLLQEPLAVLYDPRRGTLLYVLPEASARRPQIVVEFAFMTRRRAASNLIISGYRPMLADLQARIGAGDLLLLRGGVD